MLSGEIQILQLRSSCFTLESLDDNSCASRGRVSFSLTVQWKNIPCGLQVPPGLDPEPCIRKYNQQIITLNERPMLQNIKLQIALKDGHD
jgi:hypothetical protein